MKLDLIAIGKLSPAGLWDLAELAAVISMLANLVRGRFGGGVCVRRATGMVKLYRKQLAARTLDNFNMQAKAWVKQCPQRIAHVRGVIGEAAIKRWQKNRLLDYAFTETFGDWQKAFPQGLTREDTKPSRKLTRKLRYNIRAYIWKPFALVKIPNAVRILYGQSMPKCAPDHEAEDIRAAYIKLWGVDIADTPDSPKTTQPRQPRAVAPVRFTSCELVPKMALLAEAATAALAKLTDGDIHTERPPETLHKSVSRLLIEAIPAKEDNPAKEKIPAISREPPQQHQTTRTTITFQLGQYEITPQ